MLLLLVVPVDQGSGLGAAPHTEVVGQLLLPPDDRLRFPKEEDKLEVNSSGEPRGVDMTAITK